MMASGSRKNAMMMWRCIGVSRSEEVLILGYLDTTARTNTKEENPGHARGFAQRGLHDRVSPPVTSGLSFVN